MQPRNVVSLVWLLVCPLSLAAPANRDVEYDVEYLVPGLEKPAEILVDKWGVPHIYAGDHYDAFFVQGFNAARDRLWQIDLWRRRGLGQLSAILGSKFVEQDTAARLFLYRGDMFREWLAYGNDAKRIAEAFTQGINAYVQLTTENPALLPIEFTILGYEPAIWSAEDVVRIRSNGLWRNVSSEVTRAVTICKYGLDADAIRKKLEPPWQTTIPKGLDPCDIPEDVDRLYSLAKASVDFSRADQFASVSPADEGQRLSALAPLSRGAGSNNWAVSPKRTATGRPILASDPHRRHEVPSLRYISHLSAPGIDVIGAGEPALPGISIGHNERIAFGLTIFAIDQEDLLVYEVSRNRHRYQYKGESVDFDTFEETIEIKGGDARKVKLEFTVHGPVIFKDRKRAYAVRAAWLEPGMAPYFGSVEYMRAQNWREFLGALNRWGAPSENQVYADTDGNIGYKPAGLMPVRRNYDGLLPVPGNGDYEWDGFYDMDALPVEFNPSRGWVATANAMSLPADYPYKTVKPGFEWSSPWRIDRIWEVLGDTPRHTLEDSIRLQRDYVSTPARRILTAIDRQTLPALAKDLFDDWDYRLTRDSAAAALFEVWLNKYLKQAVMATLIEVPADKLGSLDPLVVVETIETMEPMVRSRVVAESLESAIATTKALLGDDTTVWRWGDIHLMKFEHPLASLVDENTKKLLAMPVVSRGGSGDTPNATTYYPNYAVGSGASWRMVLDVGNWDEAFMTNAPGQSGDPGSPHYADMLETWGEDGVMPLLYSREAVLDNTNFRIRLVPQ